MMDWKKSRSLVIKRSNLSNGSSQFLQERTFYWQMLYKLKLVSYNQTPRPHKPST